MGHFQQNPGIFNFTAQGVALVNQVGELCLFLEHGRGFFRVIPEIGPGTDEFEFLQAVFLDRQVKDTP
jgi:hypothetical protein